MQTDSLREAKLILDRIWHRNKNQHRAQSWWKWLGMLRRGVRDLLEFSPPLSERAAGRTAKEVRQRLEAERERSERRERVEERVREVLLPGCWRAFSALVADAQFGALGVVLVGVLGRVGRCVGLPAEMEREKVDEVMATSSRVTGMGTGEVVEGLHGGEDLGVLVKRGEETATGQEGQDEMATESRGEDDRGRLAEDRAKGAGARSTTKTVSPKEPEAKEKKRKRRKKGNAIDDIFAGF